MLRLIRPRADLRPLYEAALATGSDEEWMRDLFEQAETVLDGVVGFGVHTARLEGRRPVELDMRCATGALGRPGRFASALEAVRPMGAAIEAFYARPMAAMASDLITRAGGDVDEAYEPFGGVDVGSIAAHTSESDVISLNFELDRRYAFTPHEQRQLDLFSLYFQLGAQVRATGPAGGTLSARGELLDGAGVPSGRLWPSLCSGRYSLLERGRAETLHYQVVENPRLQWLRRALSPLEKKVLELSARGLTGKQQAFELGVAATTVSARLTSAAAKLGPATVPDAIRVVSGLLPRLRRVEALGLSGAERDVLTLVQQGLSNREIAHARDRSERTVANQLAALLRKTGLPGRRALLALP